MRALSWLWLVVLMTFSAHAQYTGTNTTARMLLGADAVKPGDEFTVALHFKMNPDWHTYWVNPGEAGQAIAAEWKLPAGFTASALQWPVPEKIDTEGIVTYGFHDETTLLATIKVGASVAPGPHALEVALDWQECKTLCLLARTNLTADIIVGSETVPSAHAALIAEAQARLPVAGDALKATAAWAGPPKESEREFSLEFTPPKAGVSYDFYPYAAKEADIMGATTSETLPDGKVRLKKKVVIYGKDWPTTMAGIIVPSVARGARPETAYEVSAELSGGAKGPVTVGGLETLPPSPAAAQSLLAMLITAFIGGLILNIMPCVLPVISLKILGFVQQSAERPARVRQLGFIYGLGVLASFMVLGGLVVAVKMAGNDAIWGMQFQNPVFVICMITLITLVALNLFGVFEITLGGNALSTASTLASKEGASGAFFNGVLTTALATPCSAPFLGAALGFAFTQSAPVILLVFAFIAFGLAFPYVLLTSKPEWLRYLPKPGPWMVRFKQLMGFPMMATAFWLLDIALGVLGNEQIFWLGLFITMVAIAAYIWGEFVQKGVRPALSRAVAALLIFGAYYLVLERELNWRHPAPPSLAAGSDGGNFEPGVWVPWSHATLAKARELGRPILVDFTARSCLTCKLNKKFVIDTAEVQERIRDLEVITLKADFTSADPVIAKEILKFGRSGIPMVLVYPSDPTGPPQLLPEILKIPMVIEALEKAAGTVETAAANP